MTGEEAAWVAGFLEGDGYFMLKRGRLLVGANQVNPEPLQRLQEILGGSIYKRTRVMGKKGTQSPNKRAWYGWEMRDQEDILSLTEQIRPWLSADRLSRIPWIEETADLPLVI